MNNIFNDKQENCIANAIKELNQINIDNKYTVKLDIIFSDNLFKDTIKNSDEEEIKAYTKYSEQHIERYNKFNGLTLSPNTKRDNFIILINTKTIDNNYNFLHTIIHELTHTFDYSMYMQDYSINTGMKFFGNSDYQYIFYWSEFHARYMGYKYYINFLIPSKDVQLANSIKYDFPAHMKYLKDDLQDHSLNFERKLVSVCYEYGRFRYYQEIGFDPIHDDRFISTDLVNVFGSYIIDLYDLFMNTRTYEEFILNYSAIEFYIDQISHEFK